MSKENEELIKQNIRGMVEIGFDHFQQEQVLRGILTITKQLEPAIKNREDAAMGLIFGAIWERYATAYLRDLGRPPNLEENLKIIVIFREKALFIQERIKRLLMK